MFDKSIFSVSVGLGKEQNMTELQRLKSIERRLVGDLSLIQRLLLQAEKDRNHEAKKREIADLKTEEVDCLREISEVQKKIREINGS